MKYFYIEIESPYCGEILAEYAAAESEESLYETGKIDELIAENTAAWCDSDDYETYGFDCAEEFEEYYISDSSVTIKEISKEEYYENVWSE